MYKTLGRVLRVYTYSTNRDSRLTLAGPCSLPLEFPARIWRNLARGTHYLKRFPSKEYCSGRHLAGLPWASTNRSSPCPCNEKERKKNIYKKGISYISLFSLFQEKKKNYLQTQTGRPLQQAPLCCAPLMPIFPSWVLIHHEVIFFLSLSCSLFLLCVTPIIDLHSLNWLCFFFFFIFSSAGYYLSHR